MPGVFPHTAWDFAQSGFTEPFATVGVPCSVVPHPVVDLALQMSAIIHRQDDAQRVGAAGLKLKQASFWIV